MTYFVIHPDKPKPEMRDGVPTHDDLTRLVGGFPELVPTAQGDELVLWVNDDFVSRGLPRNLLATLLRVTTGGAENPLAGSAVVTGLARDVDGYRPATLPLNHALAMEALLHDAAAFYGLTGEARDLPGIVREFLEQAREVALGPYPQTQVIVVETMDDLIKKLRDGQ